MTINTAVLRDATLSILLDRYQGFAGICSFHLQFIIQTIKAVFLQSFGICGPSYIVLHPTAPQFLHSSVYLVISL
jgi:hypothetical protein